jgi:hypothetical protein
VLGVLAYIPKGMDEETVNLLMQFCDKDIELGED